MSEFSIEITRMNLLHLVAAHTLSFNETEGFCSKSIRLFFPLLCFSLGKELGNRTYQWTTNDDTNTQALSTLTLLQVKEERQQQKEEWLILPPVVVFLLSPEENLVSKAIVCLYHRSSSIGEYSFIVLFLTSSRN